MGRLADFGTSSAAVIASSTRIFLHMEEPRQRSIWDW